MATRNVVVAMPFGRREAERRKAILNFSRLKYIIENKCQVVPLGSRTTGERVAYDVDLARTAMDNIPEKALMQIDKADILIALLSERNLTVAYELGYRRARERTVILMVASEDDVPIYEAKVAHQSWKQDDVLAEIDDIAGKGFPTLADFQVDIPGALKDVIDARDDLLIRGLELALQEIENNFVVLSPDPVQKLRGMLSDAITRFYPFSLVEVRFSKNGEFEDPKAPAKIVDFDEEFSRLYGYAGRNAARQDQPLTLDRLLDRIKKFSDTDDWNKFLQEQVTLTETVIKDHGFARATVPIRINSTHTDSQFKCKSFLPCMAAQVTDGNFDGPHRMYLLIVYIEIQDETAPLSTGGEG
jgi:nucleoside 2-deoxyribosyltransferase